MDRISSCTTRQWVPTSFVWKPFLPHLSIHSTERKSLLASSMRAKPEDIRLTATAKHNVLAHRVTALSEMLKQLLFIADRYIAIDISLTCGTTAFDIFLGNSKSRKQKKQDINLIQIKSSVNSRL